MEQQNDQLPPPIYPRISNMPYLYIYKVEHLTVPGIKAIATSGESRDATLTRIRAWHPHSAANWYHHLVSA